MQWEQIANTFYRSTFNPRLCKANIKWDFFAAWSLKGNKNIPPSLWNKVAEKQLVLKNDERTQGEQKKKIHQDNNFAWGVTLCQAELHNALQTLLRIFCVDTSWFL